MGNVRLRYASVITFAIRILSLVTGFLFTVIVTRNLSSAEFGQWNIISSLIVYGAFPAGLISYWLTRFTARGTPVASIGILINILFSLAGIVIYFSLASLYVIKFSESWPIFLLAALQVPTYAFVNALDSISFGKKPELSAYGFLVYEIVKVVLAFVLIPELGLRLSGAILVIIVTQVAEAAYFVYIIRDEIVKKVNKGAISTMMRALWIPAYSKMSSLLETTDVIIVSLSTSSYIPVALFKAANVFTSTVIHAAYMSGPLYVKLLGGGDKGDVESILKLTLLVSIPTAVGVIILANPLLFILNPDYTKATPLVAILAVYAFILTLSSVFNSVILGTETVDIAEKISMQQFFKSKLFSLPTIDNVSLVGYLSALAVALTISHSSQVSFIQIGIIWASLLVGSNIPGFAYKWHMARKILSFRFPAHAVGKYLAAVLIMGFTLWMLQSHLAYSSRTIEFAPAVFGLILLAIGIYFGILILIDKETRNLISVFINTIRTKGIKE